MRLYLDGDLEESLQVEGEGHFTGCPDCCVEVVSWQTAGEPCGCGYAVYLLDKIAQNNLSEYRI